VKVLTKERRVAQINPAIPGGEKTFKLHYKKNSKKEGITRGLLYRKIPDYPRAVRRE